MQAWTAALRSAQSCLDSDCAKHPLDAACAVSLPATRDEEGCRGTRGSDRHADPVISEQRVNSPRRERHEAGLAELRLVDREHTIV